ncbi:MAG TPA: hypothetical protein VMM60_11640 [Ilumatobacter sp.]|nr:hypothetical protein [Ilumatobacter sp.]
MTDATITPATDTEQAAPLLVLARATARAIRVLIVAGVPTGVIVVGIGSRLAMFVLRVTSSDRVNGITSDDGFIIGRFTLSGTYNLLMLGAAVGVIGAAAYQWVRPWLIGPGWFRSVTLACASGAVVGSMLVHADGIDFRLLDPWWFAIALFVVLPALFAVAIGWAVDHVERRRVPSGYRRWAVPAVLVLAFPLVLVLLVLASLIAAAWFAVRQVVDMSSLARRPAVALTMRVVWFGVAVLGALALANDISEIRQVN